MRVRKLFMDYYVNAQRPSELAVENVMTFMLTNNKPFSCTPRRLSYDEKSKLRSILNELSAKPVIRESTSEHASPIMLTEKKNGETRTCINFRSLNKITT